MFGFGYFTRKYNALKQKTVDTTNDTIELCIKIAIILLTIFTIVWIAIFLYVAFYYTYVPSIEHIRTAHLEFTPCEGDIRNGKTVCSFPRAKVMLTKTNQLLMVGQLYKISVNLEVPESEENKNLGMFLVCAQLYSKNRLVEHSCRSAILRYRSPLLKTMRLFTFGGLYMANVIEEKQNLDIELFSNFEDDQNFPITSMHVELKSERVQVYSSKVRIHAHLSGLRYLMFHWPASSAVLGVIFNVIVILFIVVLSWWQLYGPNSLTGEDFLFTTLKQTLRSKYNLSKHKKKVIEISKISQQFIGS